MRTIPGMSQRVSIAFSGGGVFTSGPARFSLYAGYGAVSLFFLHAYLYALKNYNKNR